MIREKLTDYENSIASDIEGGFKDCLAKEKKLKAMMLESEQDITAGRTVAHGQVMRWLESWGMENELSSPTVYEGRDNLVIVSTVEVYESDAVQSLIFFQDDYQTLLQALNI